MAEKKKVLLRIDAALLEEIKKWAAEDKRSVNGEIADLLAAVINEKNERRENHELWREKQRRKK